LFFVDRTAAMSNITISSNLGSAIGAAADANQTPPPAKPQATPQADTPAVPTDAISLSLAAQANGAASSSSQTLSDSAASAQSYELRQQLSTAPLSGTARQNQAIVALLR
jgi:hypothetical protein